MSPSSPSLAIRTRFPLTLHSTAPSCVPIQSNRLDYTLSCLSKEQWLPWSRLILNSLQRSRCSRPGHRLALAFNNPRHISTQETRRRGTTTIIGLPAVLARPPIVTRARSSRTPLQAHLVSTPHHNGSKLGLRNHPQGPTSPRASETRMAWCPWV